MIQTRSGVVLLQRVRSDREVQAKYGASPPGRMQTNVVGAATERPAVQLADTQ